MTIGSGPVEADIWPVMVEGNDTAYSYNENYISVFENRDIQCKGTRSNLTNISNTHAPYAHAMPFYSSNPLCMFRGVMPSVEKNYEKNDYMLG